MAKYEVQVIVTVLDYYIVAAESAQDAMDRWRDGEHSHTDSDMLDGEAIRASRL